VDPTNPAITNSLWVCCIRSLAVFVKTVIIIFVFMWVRWSLPRFRFDQVMMLAWRALIPMSLALLAMTAIIVYFWAPMQATLDKLDGWTSLALLCGNVLVLLFSMGISMVLPPAPETNRKIRIPGSRYNRTPLPAGV
jgi:NADH-quinone oxidoreductase subunit H